MVEVSIRVSGEDTALVQKHLVYDPITLDHNDPTLKRLVETAIDNFKGRVEDVIIKLKFTW